MVARILAPPSSRLRSAAPPPVEDRESGEQLCASECPTLPPPPSVRIEHFHTTPVDMDELLYRLSVGDHEGALGVAESLLREDPIPLIIVAGVLLQAMNLSHRDEYVLSFVDGCSTLGEVVLATGLVKLEALRSVCELLERNVIALR
jgi:hypothetical protein